MNYNLKSEMKGGNGLKGDFFRKNIFTIGGVVVFILMLFFIMNPFNSKQSSNKESLNKIKKENKQLKQENVNLLKKLKTERSFYTDKINQQMNASRTASDEIIAEYQKLFEYLQKEIKNELVDSLSIFSPELTKKGDKIAGLIVSDIRKESANGSISYHIDFTGQFMVKGSLIHDQSDGGYKFIVEENLEKLPHSLQEFKGVLFNIINGNELVKVFGEKLEKMPDSDKLEIEAVFKNYSYNNVP
jgi:regulator of replication initiation timing